MKIQVGNGGTTVDIRPLLFVQTKDDIVTFYSGVGGIVEVRIHEELVVDSVNLTIGYKSKLAANQKNYGSQKWEVMASISFQLPKGGLHFHLGL